MNWTVFLSTFTTIFLAEIGDKTQFAAMAASAQSDSKLSVLLATIIALSLAGALGVLFGSLLSQFITPDRMRYISSSAFILMGIFILLKG